VAVSDSKETFRVLDLGLRIGEILLSSGAGAADVTATMRAIVEHAGLRRTDIDVTFTALRMSHQSDPEEMPVLAARYVTERTIDYDELTRCQELVDRVLGDRVSIQEARARVARLSSGSPWVPSWAIPLGSAVFGGGIALLLGAGAVVTAVAAVAGVLVTALRSAMAARAWPMFYQQAAGGFLGTAIALGVTSLGLHGINPSLLVTSSIVLLLSGIGFMGAMQDALSGFYLTASARILEALLATAGLIAGVTGGLALAARLSVSLTSIEPGKTVRPAMVALAVLGAVLAACAFAFVSYAPWRALPAVAVATVLGQLVSVGLNAPGQSVRWSAALSAIVIGAVSHSIAGRFRVPPLVVVVPSLVPLLPGLLIYRGLSFIAGGDTRGILQLTSAGAITIALAAGVILGEYISQPLKRNARRIESRLRGPRLAGVLHTHRGREVSWFERPRRR
jgi:uncharacterized membrane protein YjjP (DUF1212 family)